MADVTIFHNPNCTTSKYAVGVAAELGVDAVQRRYLSKAQRLSREEVVDLLAMLEDPATDLVRRDATFSRLGLTDADVATADQVTQVLVDHPELLQRPVLVKDGRAIIGRPKDRVEAFLVG